MLVSVSFSVSLVQLLLHFKDCVILSVNQQILYFDFLGFFSNHLSSLIAAYLDANPCPG